jgi:hypothetical protein
VGIILNKLWSVVINRVEITGLFPLSGGVNGKRFHLLGQSVSTALFGNSVKQENRNREVKGVCFVLKYLTIYPNVNRNYDAKKKGIHM